MKDLRVACSPLTGTIFGGKVCKDGVTWRDNKKDVTNDVLKAIIDKIQLDSPKTKTLIIRENGVSKYEIVLKEITLNECSIDKESLT